MLDTFFLGVLCLLFFPMQKRTSGEAIAYALFENVRKFYRDFFLRPRLCALQDFNLTLMPGEVVGLLGENGSGKSTCLKLLVGLIRPSSGLVQLFGLNPQLAQARSKLGYLPENNSFDLFATSLSSLMLHGRLGGLTRKEAAREAWRYLEYFEIEEFAKRPIKNLSKGTQRKIGLSQAFIAKPQLLVLDEAGSGLDPLSIEKLRELIRTKREEGGAVILASHSLSEIDQLCDRLFVLKKGKTLLTGKREELLRIPDEYQVRFTAEALKSKNKQGQKGELEAKLQGFFEEESFKITKLEQASYSLPDFYRKLMAKMPEEKGDQDNQAEKQE